MGNRRPRTLSEDDRILWQTAMRDVDRPGTGPAAGSRRMAEIDLDRPQDDGRTRDAGTPDEAPLAGQSATGSNASPEIDPTTEPSGRKTVLSDDDMAAWREEVGDIGPDSGGQSEGPANPPSEPAKPGQNGSIRPLSNRAKPPESRSESFDRKLFARLMKGQERIEARLDLHGLTAEQAFVRLGAFIGNAYGSGRRNLLVITGKGKRSGADVFNRPQDGILRRSVPRMLSGPPLSRWVHSFIQSHERHGGTGALYVRLRRNRQGTGVVRGDSGPNGMRHEKTEWRRAD
ncbi:MAG: Smr/MutS family protein [Paracoccaceae bacterium]|nr:Smr/MutS family protein [Paracoccaceae bacterium]